MEESLQQNFTDLREKIQRAAERAGRDADEIRLMAVTKTKPRSMILGAYECGQRLFGENRVFEAEEKYQDVADDIELHLIGHLQRNKAKTAAQLFEWVDSIDKTSTARELQKQCAKNNKQMNILLEFNTSGEETKEGFRGEDEMWKTIDEILTMSNLTIRGLMTIAPFSDDEKRVRRSFAKLRELFFDLQKRYPDLAAVDTLSMGMSHDFELAIEEGSNMVRIGSLIFGKRD
jgi:hypothetical protein